MKRVTHQIIHRIHSSDSDPRISRTDYYQIFTSAFMLIVGVVILFRSFIGSITLMSLLVGGGFLALGCYRLYFVVKYFRERGKWDHR